MAIKKKLITLTVITAILLLIFSISNPSSVSALVYIGVFAIVYLWLYCIISVVIELAYPGMKQGPRRFASIVLSFGPVVVLALSTLTDITALDIVLALGTPGVICWYSLSRGLVK